MKRKLLFAGLWTNLIMVGFIASGCLVLDADVVEMSKTVSPDRRYVAVIYSVDGGATSSHNVYVRLMMPKEKLNLKERSGDVYGVKVFDPEISVNWVDDKNVVVKCKNCLPENVFVKKQSWSDINVHFE